MPSILKFLIPCPAAAHSEAVLLWAIQDNLTVFSENCVVTALTAWVAANGVECSPSQLQRLAFAVRVVNVSPSFLR